MTQMTIDEARERLDEATSKYKQVETALAQSVVGESTPERVMRNVELQAALHETAQALVEAKKLFEVIAAETAERRRERAQVELQAAEADLIEAIPAVEQSMDKLVEDLSKVLTLSKRRYAHRQEATGRAPRSLLARNTVEGWITWRLQHLELPGLDTPPHHYRAPLADLLGLNTDNNEETT